MKNVRFHLPLFWKFSIAIVFIVLVFGSINSILIYKNVRTSLRHETEKRGLFIAKSITNQVSTMLLFEDYVGLENALNTIKNIDNAIDYIFILDGKNELLVHTFPDEFPSDLINANSLGEKFSSHTQLLQFHNQVED
ncbi:MAG: two-component sensor histidine kinase, partial [Ignavibacteriales bacterium]|nr:two-component sensor histidine kinase [Ignavibacteriales bacterium]